MSRVINIDGIGKQRTRLSKEVVLSIRELMKQKQPDSLSRDLAAFVALALIEIASTIDVSVTAWEKRGYWVKADRFRMEWLWAGRMGEAMQRAVLGDDWPAVAATSIQVAQKLMAIQVSDKHRLGTPWAGAWDVLNKRSDLTR